MSTRTSCKRFWLAIGSSPSSISVRAAGNDDAIFEIFMGTAFERLRGGGRDDLGGGDADRGPCADRAEAGKRSDPDLLFASAVPVLSTSAGAVEEAPISRAAEAV